MMSKLFYIHSIVIVFVLLDTFVWSSESDANYKPAVHRLIFHKSYDKTLLNHVTEDDVMSSISAEQFNSWLRGIHLRNEAFTNYIYENCTNDEPDSDNQDFDEEIQESTRRRCDVSKKVSKSLNE